MKLFDTFAKKVGWAVTTIPTAITIVVVGAYPFLTPKQQIAIDQLKEIFKPAEVIQNEKTTTAD